MLSRLDPEFLRVKSCCPVFKRYQNQPHCPGRGVNFMRMKPTYLYVAAALAALSSAAFAADAPSGVDLTGTWVLNQKLSDNPQEMWKQHNASGGGGGGGHHGGYSGSGGGGYSGHGGGGGSGAHNGSGGGQPGQHGGGGGGGGEFAPVQKLTIVESGDKVVMIPEGRDSVIVVPDGKSRDRQTPNGVAKVQASWTEAALQVKMTSPTGREATRLYRINADGRLEVVTELPAPPNSNEAPREIVMRYDEAAATATKPATKAPTTKSN
jgi:hypothetical protein